MFSLQLDSLTEKKQTLLCIGLDPELEYVISVLGTDDFFKFNKLIIDATHKFALAFKPQIAHYAALGKEQELLQTIDYIKKNHPEIPVILDSKRGDIGNTATKYAMEAFDRYRANAVTVNPYMGLDSVSPFMKNPNNGVIVLSRTSNKSAFIQEFIVDGEPLYLKLSKHLYENASYKESLMFVVGATMPHALQNMAEQFPTSWFLIPGVGAQGGKVSDVFEALSSKPKPRAMINVSRGILPENVVTTKEFSSKVTELTKLYYDEIKHRFFKH